MSSSTPTRQITTAATSTARESCCTVGWPPEERQLPGHHDRGRHPGQHRHPAEVGHLDGVHVAVAHLGQRPGPQRQPAAQPADQVGDRGRDQQDQQVLAHSAPAHRSGGFGSTSAALASPAAEPSSGVEVVLELVEGRPRARRRAGPSSSLSASRSAPAASVQVVDVGQRLAQHLDAQGAAAQHLAVVALGEVDDGGRAHRSRAAERLRRRGRPPPGRRAARRPRRRSAPRAGR